MKRRNKFLIFLIVVFVVITVAGSIYTLKIQGKELDEKDEELVELRANYSSIETLLSQLKVIEERVAVVDSLLFSGKFTIPKNISQSRFFDFIDKYSKDYALYTFTNTEFITRGIENGFDFYTYKVSGNGKFDDVYKLIYAVEHSKELKKIQSADITGTTSVDTRGIPRYLVKFTLEVKVYFSASDQYAEINYTENELKTKDLHDAYYPLVRNQIGPNVHNLPNIQDAALISLVPQGAFIMDSKGNTLLLKKGDQVYLGYLTDIDYDNETVTFVLNKGGIIEYETLKMGKNTKREGKR